MAAGFGIWYMLGCCWCLGLSMIMAVGINYAGSTKSGKCQHIGQERRLFRQLAMAR
jgi:hypothetical protein